MLHSFRLKLALLSAGATGFLVLAFGISLWAYMLHSGKETLDQEIGAVAKHFMEVGPRLQEVGGSEFYGEQLHQVSFAVEHVQKGVLYRSSDWPKDLEEARLPCRPGTPGAQPRCKRLHSPWNWKPGGEQAGPGGGQHAGHQPPPGFACPCQESAFTTVRLGGGPWRVAAFPDGPLTLFVAVDMERFQARTARLTGIFLLALPLALLAAGGGGWWLAGRALRPVAALTSAAEEITADQLERRIPAEGADLEFVRLTQVFNEMLERLQCSYQQAVRFSADVSHELKTPLAIMQGEVEAALSGVPEGSPAQQALASQLEEIHRLTGMVHRLLLLSRADAGTLSPQLATFNVSECLTDLCEDFQALSSDLSFDLEIQPEVAIEADPALFPLVLSNLLANAAKYNQPEGSVQVRLAGRDGEVRLSVSNTGPAIGAEEAERIFGRFYRGDPARGREAGAGLGLSLAREVARAHGAELTFEGSTNGINTFALALEQLPAA